MAAPSFTDMGKTDVLIIISDPATNNPAVIPRRPHSELTYDERVKLENQGVAREHHTDDLSIMKARYSLDKDCCIVGVEHCSSDRELSCGDVKEKINSVLNGSNNQSVVIHYIGSGKKRTGDWCFSDGFLTFRDIMTLYMAHRRPRGRPVLFICSDCSHSGSWIKEGMSFLDEKGVGPCGHAAKEKDITLTVHASCLSSEVPQELAFSTHSIKNDKNNGCVLFGDYYRNKKIVEGQHPTKVNFFSIQCKNELEKPCTMAPGSTWKMWRAAERVYIISHTDNIQPEWSIVVFVDDESIICRVLVDRTMTEQLADHVHVLKSGWGSYPPDDVKQWLQDTYKIDYNYSPP